MKKKGWAVVLIVILSIVLGMIFWNRPSFCRVPTTSVTVQKKDDTHYYIQIHDCAKLNSDGGNVDATIGVNVYVNEENQLYFVNRQEYSNMHYNEWNQEIFCYDDDIVLGDTKGINMNVENENSFFRIQDNEITGYISFAVNRYENRNKKVDFTDIYSILEYRRNYQWLQYYVEAEYHMIYEFVDGELLVELNKN